MTTSRWQDRLNLALGIWLLVSPWVLGLPLTSALAACVLGAAIVAAALWAMRAPQATAPEWTNVALGVLAFVTPFVLSFAATAWIPWMVGFIVAIVAGTEIAMIGEAPKHA